MISIGDVQDLAYNLRRIIDLAEDITQHPGDSASTIAKLAKSALESLQEP